MKIKLLRPVGSYGIILNPESAFDDKSVRFESEIANRMRYKLTVDDSGNLTSEIAS